MKTAPTTARTSTPKRKAAATLGMSADEITDRLIKSAALLRIDLIAMTASRVLDAATPNDEPRSTERLSVNIGGTSAYEAGPDGRSLIFYATVECSVSMGSAPQANMATTLRLVYAIAPDMPSLPDETINAFSEKLAMQHAWPFLRERIRTMSVDLSLPPLILPIRRPALSTPQKAKT